MTFPANLTTRPWSETELSALHRLYPRASPETVKAAIPRRSWEAIQGRASLLGVKRTYRARRVVSRARPRSRVWADIIAARVAAGMTQDELARLVGCSNQAGVASMEAERRGVSVFMLTAVCDALGLELRAVPVRAARVAKAKPLTLVERMQRQAAADMERVAKEMAA